MTPIVARVRREVYLPAYVDAIATRRARASGRSKSRVHADAILTLNALLAGTLPADVIANQIKAEYGVDPNGN